MGEFPNKATQFSGTPGPGRPPGSINMRTLLREMLSDGRLGEAGDLWLAQWQKAKEGDTQAAKFIIDNLEGLLTQKVEQVVVDERIIPTVLDIVSEMFGQDKALEVSVELGKRLK